MQIGKKTVVLLPGSTGWLFTTSDYNEVEPGKHYAFVAFFYGWCNPFAWGERERSYTSGLAKMVKEVCR